MAAEFKVVIFDDAKTDIYRERAAESVREAEGVPYVFDQVGPAWDSLQSPITALVTGLGTRESTVSFSYQFPALPLLREAGRQKIPVALLSGHPRAAEHIDIESGDIVVPKQPYEAIAPALHEWFEDLLNKV